jgi:hypothetical protein
MLVIRAAAQHPRGDTAAVRVRFPRVRVIEAPEGTTVPRLRAVGIGASRGDIVALLEDDCLVQDGWCKAAMSLIASPHVALGGAVEPGPYRRGLDWAVYFCEYARFMSPVPTDASPPLPGNNTVFRRTALMRAGTDAEGFQEAFAHAAWVREGLTTGASDRLVVTNINRWPARQVVSVPFHHGRAYAANRFSGKPPAIRLAFAMATPVLPLVKIARLYAETSSRRRLIGRLCRALPWVMLFTTSWSAGEAVGCLAGSGGSAARWRS